MPQEKKPGVRSNQAEEDTARPADGTMQLPAANYADSLPPTPVDLAAAMTLPPPPRTMGPNEQPTIVPGPGVTKPLTAQPQDQTLDPNDPKAKAFQEAVVKSTPPTSAASFGDYQIIDTIAKGGMGIVYKARQRKLNRVVAIKMILAGQFADETDVERFYAEAKAAATLSHPNIVGIHEIGEVSGQHFFSMDYIDGESLSQMVRSSPLTAQSAANFGKTIAETMQFAHEHGILHRDLKPSNILVDRKHRPLITDFGLAKQVSNESQLTMSGAIVGTPSYMPPEQARGDAKQVGTCSDIYSIGAILYELVTGRPPFRAATPFETVRQVIENEPVSPRVINTSVPKDLETIILKCLQKEPAKRYASCQELADELGRFMRGEPIIARPIGRIARFWRLCRRNPIPATAIAASVLFLIIAAVGSTVGMVRTQQALVKERASFRKQLDVVNDLLISVSENRLLQEDGMQVLRKELLDKALAYYQGFAQDKKDDPEVQDEVAASHYRIGLITELTETADKALPHYEAALELQTKLLARERAPKRVEALSATLNSLGIVHARMKEYDDAHDFYRQAVALREELVQLDPQNVEYRRLLANSEMNIGIAHADVNDFAAAKKQYQRAQDLRHETLKLDQENEKLRRDWGKGEFSLGVAEQGLQDFPAAEQHLRRAISTFEQLLEELSQNEERDHELTKNLANAYRILGDVCFAKVTDEDDEAAGEAYLQSLRIWDGLVNSNPRVPIYKVERSGTLFNLGVLKTESNPVEAKLSLKLAEKALRPIVAAHPQVLRYRRDFGKVLQASAFIDAAGDNFPSARELYREAAEVFEELTVERPAEIEYLQHYAAILKDWGEMELRAGQFADAVSIAERECRQREVLAKVLNEDPLFELDLAEAVERLAEAHQKKEDATSATQQYQRAEKILTAVAKKLPMDAAVSEALKRVQAALAKLKPAAGT